MITVSSKQQQYHLDSRYITMVKKHENPGCGTRVECSDIVVSSRLLYNFLSSLAASASMSEDFHRSSPPTTSATLHISLGHSFAETTPTIRQNHGASLWSTWKSWAWQQKNALLATPAISSWRWVYLHKIPYFQNQRFTIKLVFYCF